MYLERETPCGRPPSARAHPAGSLVVPPLARALAGHPAARAHEGLGGTLRAAQTGGHTASTQGSERRLNAAPRAEAPRASPREPGPPARGGSQPPGGTGVEGRSAVSRRPPARSRRVLQCLVTGTQRHEGLRAGDASLKWRRPPAAGGPVDRLGHTALLTRPTLLILPLFLLFPRLKTDFPPDQKSNMEINSKASRK